MIHIYQSFDIVESVVAIVPGDRGSIPGRVIPKIQKWYLIPTCITLNI